MKHLASVAFLFLLFCSLSLALEPRAHAYVDPGSGLLITQTAGAVLTAGLFWFRRHLRSFFGRFGAARKTK